MCQFFVWGFSIKLLGSGCVGVPSELLVEVVDFFDFLGEDVAELESEEVLGVFDLECFCDCFVFLWCEEVLYEDGVDVCVDCG